MKSISLNFSILFPIIIVFTSLSSSCSTNKSLNKDNNEASISFPSTNLSSIDFAYEEMIKNQISPEFASYLEKKYLKDKKSIENRDQIIQLNVLGFLTPGDYSRHYSLSAVKNIKKFLKKYKLTLSKAEKKYQVPKEIIASLLWVETKHGKTMGTYPLPMVYFTLLQSTHPEVAKTTLNELNFRKPSSNSSAANLSHTELQQKVALRLANKSKWAIEQIKTLEKLSLKQKTKTILNSKSSFAGAFGCSQFIPSSYEKYAVSNSRKNPNLFDLKDCILSVGNFLNKSGWDSQNPKAQSDALFEYNRIRDYGDVIQKLALEAGKT